MRPPPPPPPMVISSWGGDAVGGTQSQCAQRSLSFFFLSMQSFPFFFYFFSRKFYPCLIYLTEGSQPPKLPVVNERTNDDAIFDWLSFLLLSSVFLFNFLLLLLLLLLLLVWKWKSPNTHGHTEKCTNPKTWKISLEGECKSILLLPLYP